MLETIAQLFESARASVPTIKNICFGDRNPEPSSWVHVKKDLARAYR